MIANLKPGENIENVLGRIFPSISKIEPSQTTTYELGIIREGYPNSFEVLMPIIDSNSRENHPLTEERVKGLVFTNLGVFMPREKADKYSVPYSSKHRLPERINLSLEE